jgi:zinc protease
MDSDFYGTDGFVDLVKNGLNDLTVEQVNAVIKKHLQMDNMQFVFITKEGADMKDRLVNDTSSPMTYNSAKPESLMAEDVIIQDLSLKLKKSQVEVVDIEKVFK